MSWFWSPTSNVSGQYRLKVSASGNDDKSSFKVVPVNSDTSLRFSTSIGVFQLLVKVKNFIGSSKYYSKENYKSSYFEAKPQDNLSIQISFEPFEVISGDELIFGNDFEYPIRDCLPRGTSIGMRLFSYVDPSVEGDIYADRPYLYGKALSSFNFIEQGKSLNDDGSIITENLYAITDKFEISDLKIPQQNTKRQTYFTNVENLSKFKFIPKKTYKFDFCNQYLSLKDSKFKISLPGGFELDLSSYLVSLISSNSNGGKDNFKSVRWVFKRKNDETSALIIKFELVEEKDDEIVKEEISVQDTLRNDEEADLGVD